MAAYKSVEVARRLASAGARVKGVMTRSAERFVGPVTLSGITGSPVASDMWDPSFPGEMHVALSDLADLIAIVPATADMLARLAQGRADDLVSALALSARSPVLCAPAMHPRMWAHPATRRNVEELREQGRVIFCGPVEGPVASGDVGMGRMAEPEQIVAAIAKALSPRGPGDLAGKRLLITAGPTHEAIDPVRYLGNRSSGKMGFALASRAAARGASVCLVSGPVSLETPPGVRRVDVETAEEMSAALDVALGAAMASVDAVVMAAAVADFRPLSFSEIKIKKEPGSDAPVIALTRNPDILAGLGARREEAARKTPLLVGFALETGSDEEVLGYARRKLSQKKVDLVVANRADQSIGQDRSRIALVTGGAQEWLPGAGKERLADSILDALRALFQGMSLP